MGVAIAVGMVVLTADNQWFGRPPQSADNPNPTPACSTLRATSNQEEGRAGFLPAIGT